MIEKTNLITVPTFTFYQGEVFDFEGAERPISVDYYNDTICLRQDGDYNQQEVIIIKPEYLDKLFKAIKKYKSEAEYYKKNKTT
jgi:hypothetical protein